MKIFAIDDYTRIISSKLYKASCMNYQFNMLENRLFDFAGMYQHIVWTDKKVRQWEKERPNETTSKQYNSWLEEKFKQYKEERGI